jgi:hypothetical protein
VSESQTASVSRAYTAILLYCPLNQPLLNQRLPQLIGEGDDAGEIGSCGLIGVGPLSRRRGAVEAGLGGFARADLNLLSAVTQKGPPRVEIGALQNPPP